jgi:hypothetical protein
MCSERGVLSESFQPFRAGKENDPFKKGPCSITMLRSLVHTSEHQAFYGVVCGYLGFEGTNDKKNKKQPKPKLRGRARRTELQAAPSRIHKNPSHPSILCHTHRRSSTQSCSQSVGSTWTPEVRRNGLEPRIPCDAQETRRSHASLFISLG